MEIIYLQAQEIPNEDIEDFVTVVINSHILFPVSEIENSSFYEALYFDFFQPRNIIPTYKIQSKLLGVLSANSQGGVKSFKVRRLVARTESFLAEFMFVSFIEQSFLSKPSKNKSQKKTQELIEEYRKNSEDSVAPISKGNLDKIWKAYKKDAAFHLISYYFHHEVLNPDLKKLYEYANVLNNYLIKFNLGTGISCENNERNKSLQEHMLNVIKVSATKQDNNPFPENYCSVSFKDCLK